MLLCITRFNGLMNVVVASLGIFLQHLSSNHEELTDAITVDCIESRLNLYMEKALDLVQYMYGLSTFDNLLFNPNLVLTISY